MFFSRQSNKIKWIKNRADFYGTPLYEDFSELINDFFIKDNISHEKYVENNNANSILRGFGNPDLMHLIKMTPIFKNYFSKTIDNRGEGMPDWFYIAYPDVARWLAVNIDIIDQVVFGDKTKSHIFIKDNKPNNRFFRVVIDMYIHHNNTKLECSI